MEPSGESDGQTPIHRTGLVRKWIMDRMLEERAAGQTTTHHSRDYGSYVGGTIDSIQPNLAANRREFSKSPFFLLHSSTRKLRPPRLGISENLNVDKLFHRLHHFYLIFVYCNLVFAEIGLICSYSNTLDK
ncbi:hypothetical protein QQ045_011285 [Rhodiola kirilowii]